MGMIFYPFSFFYVAGSGGVALQHQMSFLAVNPERSESAWYMFTEKVPGRVQTAVDYQYLEDEKKLAKILKSIGGPTTNPNYSHVDVSVDSIAADQGVQIGIAKGDPILVRLSYENRSMSFMFTFTGTAGKRLVGQEVVWWPVQVR